MSNVVSKKFILSLSVLSLALGIFLFPTIALAAESVEATAPTPTAFLERSQIIGTGKQINVYRVPTIDSIGDVRCYDLTIKFGVTSGGKFKTTPTVTAIECPDVPDNKFVAGTYTSGSDQGTQFGCGDVTCTVTTSVLNGGRMEVALFCKDANCKHTFSGSAVSGPIEGHPFELDLLAAGSTRLQDTSSTHGEKSVSRIGPGGLVSMHRM